MRAMKNCTLAFLSVALAAPLAISCGHTSRVGQAHLTGALERVERGGSEVEDLARAGWAKLLLQSDRAAAKAFWLRAMEREPSPWALYGLALVAGQELDARGALEYKLRLCDRSPHTALCTAGARAALESVGTSPALDQLIEARALSLLSHGARGEAAFLLRSALARLREARGDFEGSAAMRAEQGTLSAALFLGPFSAYEKLEWRKSFPPENGELSGSGPRGAISPRPVTWSGPFELADPGSDADLYYLAADVELSESADYLLRLESSSTAALFLDGDGAHALERTNFESSSPMVRTVRVSLAKGRHRLLVKALLDGAQRTQSLARDQLMVSLARADGKPAKLRFSPAKGEAPKRSHSFEEAKESWSDAASLERALAPEMGLIAAAVVALDSVMQQDLEGVKALLEKSHAPKDAVGSASALLFAAEHVTRDPALPGRYAVGEARQYLSLALERDPSNPKALLSLGLHALREEQYSDASDALQAAAKEAAPRSFELPLTRARLALKRGADADADELVTRALELEPGLCEGLAHKLYRARALDAGEAQALEAMAPCSGYPFMLAQRSQSIGAHGAARAALARLAREEGEQRIAMAMLARTALAEGEYLEAAKLYGALAERFPYLALHETERAEALERAGDEEGARAARERALRLDGADLQLRLALALEDGKEPLGDLKIDGAKELARYKAEKPAETGAGAYVVDAMALEVSPDGSAIARIHILSKVTSQSGLSELSEVALPEGAQPLTMRTLKADGRVLEPESISGKEEISFPGVEVGDFVEYEYLVTFPARGPTVPGFTSPLFVFQMDKIGSALSVVDIRAPKGMGLFAEGRNLGNGRAGELTPIDEGAFERIHVERRGTPPFVAEPGGPGRFELVPSVLAGYGATAKDAVKAIGNHMVGNFAPTNEVREFARRATAGKQGRAAVEALYEEVMKAVGGDGHFLSSGLHALLLGRGSRFSAMATSLKALGIEFNVLVARTVLDDPFESVFPVNDKYRAPVLMVKIPKGDGGGVLYLQPEQRYAPFGRLRPQQEGQLAWVIPNPGEEPRQVMLKSGAPDETFDTTLTGKLSEEGTLTGTVIQRVVGFTAANLRVALESMSDEQKNRLAQSLVAELIPGATATSFDIKVGEASGSPVEFILALEAERFAAPLDKGLAVQGEFFETGLARNFLTLGERETPLLVAQYSLKTRISLELPAGMTLARAEQKTSRKSPFGSFELKETSAPGRYGLDWSYAMPAQRIAPANYQAFGDFVSSVDRDTSMELGFSRGK